MTMNFPGYDPVQIDCARCEYYRTTGQMADVVLVCTECGDEHYARGFCQLHYNRWWAKHLQHAKLSQ